MPDDNQNYQTGDVICRVLNVTPAELKRLADTGVIPREGKDRFILIAVVRSYIEHIRSVDDKPSQQSEIAAHLGMSDRNLRDVLKEKLKIDHRDTPLCEIRKKYIEYLRDLAAGHSDGEQYNLVKERVITERLDRQLKELILKEKLGEYVPAADIAPMFDQLVVAFRSDMLALADNLKTIIDAAYGIDVDLELINEPINDGLQRLSAFEADVGEDSNGGSDESRAASEDDDDGVG